MTVVDHAIQLAIEGIVPGHQAAVFPCNDKKEPTTEKGYLNATTSPDAIMALWRERWGPLIGVATGPRSGFDVLDFDFDKGAGPFHADNFERFGATREQSSRSGGIHLLYRSSSAPGLRCSVGRIHAGVDVRACGGYVIWWPAAGCRVISTEPVAPWPQWVLDLARSEPKADPAPSTGEAVEITAADVVNRIEGLIAEILNAPRGTRNSIIFWAGTKFAEIVRDGDLSESQALEIMMRATERASWDPLKKTRKTALNGLRRRGG